MKFAQQCRRCGKKWTSVGPLMMVFRVLAMWMHVTYDCPKRDGAKNAQRVDGDHQKS